MLTTPQILSFAVIMLMMAAFVWGRLRYDLVAAIGLLLALALGVVQPNDAFSGFSDDIVIIVGSALLVAPVSREAGSWNSPSAVTHPTSFPCALNWRCSSSSSRFYRPL